MDQKLLHLTCVSYVIEIKLLDSQILEDVDFAEASYVIIVAFRPIIRKR